MSLQFSRSLRSLRVDSFRASQIGMIIAILLMSGLIIWFFVAKVTLYENSVSLKFDGNGRIMATFSDDGMRRIKVGQSALIRLDGGSNQPTTTIPAFVYDILQNGKQVELIAAPGETVDISQGTPNGRAEVEVEYLTPAQLLIRSTGKYLNGRGIPVSPQTTRLPQNQGGQ